MVACATSLDCAYSGTTKIAHLEENLRALDLVLDAQDLRTLSAGFAALSIEGAYTGTRQMAAIDIGDQEGTSSLGSHGLSPLPTAKPSS